MKFLFNHIIVFVGSLLSTGAYPSTSELEKRKMQLINGLALLVFFFSGVLLMVTIIAGLNNQVLIAFSAMCLMIPIFPLNKVGKSGFTSIYLITTSLLLITLAAVSGNFYSQFYEIENLLLAIIILNVIVLGGSRRAFFAFVIISITLALKAFRLRMMGDISPESLVFTEIITLILCLGLHLSMQLFWKVLTEALRKNEEQGEILFSLIDNVPLHMALISPNGRFFMVNDNYATECGKSRSEIIGSKGEDVLPDHILPKHKNYLEKALRGESESFIEESILEDGTTYYGLGKFEPIYYESGEVKAVAVFVSNVTKLKETELALEKANKTREKLFSILAHDLKSPLTTFSSMLNLDKGIVTNEEFNSYRKTMKERMNATLFFVDNLLNWSRSQLNSIVAKPSATDLSEIIRETIQLYRPQMDTKNIKLFSQFTSKVMVYVDKNQLRLVVRNLLHNAIKFTPSRGTIAIELRTGEDRIHFTISDTGIGIPPQVLEDLRCKELISSKPGTEGEVGTGLGLNLCIQMLETNNCNLNVENIPGLGTCMHIYLPRNKVNYKKAVSELTSRTVTVN